MADQYMLHKLYSSRKRLNIILQDGQEVYNNLMQKFAITIQKCMIGIRFLYSWPPQSRSYENKWGSFCYTDSNQLSLGIEKKVQNRIIPKDGHGI